MELIETSLLMEAQMGEGLNLLTNTLSCFCRSSVLFFGGTSQKVFRFKVKKVQGEKLKSSQRKVKGLELNKVYVLGRFQVISTLKNPKASQNYCCHQIH